MGEREKRSEDRVSRRRNADAAPEPVSIKRLIPTAVSIFLSRVVSLFIYQLYYLLMEILQSSGSTSPSAGNTPVSILRSLQNLACNDDDDYHRSVEEIGELLFSFLCANSNFLTSAMHICRSHGQNEIQQYILKKPLKE